MPLASLLRYFSKDLAIDLGTANTLVFAINQGIVVREPSVVVINKLTNRIEAVGSEAKEMLGRTPGNIESIRPMKDGVIADFAVTERMLEYFIRKAHGRKMYVHPRLAIGRPSALPQAARRAPGPPSGGGSTASAGRTGARCTGVRGSSSASPRRSRRWRSGRSATPRCAPGRRGARWRRRPRW